MCKTTVHSFIVMMTAWPGRGGTNTTSSSKKVEPQKCFLNTMSWHAWSYVGKSNACKEIHLVDDFVVWITTICLANNRTKDKINDAIIILQRCKILSHSVSLSVLASDETSKSRICFSACLTSTCTNTAPSCTLTMADITLMRVVLLCLVTCVSILPFANQS